MTLAKVIGTVVANVKDWRLEGVRLMVIQPVNGDGSHIGEPIVAADAIGSGLGETVMYAKSKDGSFALRDKSACCDAGIAAIVDYVYLDK